MYQRHRGMRKYRKIQLKTHFQMEAQMEILTQIRIFLTMQQRKMAVRIFRQQMAVSAENCRQIFPKERRMAITVPKNFSFSRKTIMKTSQSRIIMKLMKAQVRHRLILQMMPMLLGIFPQEMLQMENLELIRL